MVTEQFDARLRELSAIVGSEQGMELFNEGYESLLSDVKLSPGPRFEKFQRMAKVLARQTEYLMNEWIKAKREKAVIDKDNEREKMQ